MATSLIHQKREGHRVRPEVKINKGGEVRELKKVKIKIIQYPVEKFEAGRFI